MKSDLPLVSIIIPVYNRERYLAEAIESVLAQTYPAIELIVVDDGSSDRSAEVAQRYLPFVKYCFQPNGGTAAARNTGIALAQGEFLAFLDSDDIWTEDKLSRQMAAFTADPDLDAAFGYVKQFYSPELDDDFRQRIRCPEDAIAGYLSGTMLSKSTAFSRVGLFNTTLRIGVDIEWYSRIVDQNLKMTLLPDVIYLRRLHQTNIGNSERYKDDLLQVIKAMLDRRRQTNKISSLLRSVD